MSETPAERAARAERVAPYLDLQLRLANRMSELTAAPLGEMALRHTNLHRRLGLGVWRDDTPPAPGWAPFVAGLEVRDRLDEQLAWTLAAFRAAPSEVLPHPGQFGFGCFAHEPVSDEGVVRMHFYNKDTDAAGGPLASAKVARRKAELAAMAVHIAETCPPDVVIRGGSWLYHLEAYRRLFPPAYADSRRPYTRPISLRGTATWGQAIDSWERIRPEIRDAVLASLPTLDPKAPHLAFPYQMLAVEAPLAVFLAFYGV